MPAPTETSVGLVVDWGNIPGDFQTGTSNEQVMSLILSAVTDVLGQHYYIDDPMTASQILAITMQAARLWGRKKTPEGVMAFADIAALRIEDMDNDVLMLLNRKITIT